MLACSLKGKRRVGTPPMGDNPKRGAHRLSIESARVTADHHMSAEAERLASEMPDEALSAPAIKQAKAAVEAAGVVPGVGVDWW